MFRDTKKIIIGIILLFGFAFTWWLSNKFEDPDTKFNYQKRHDPDYIIHKFSARQLGTRNNTQYILRAIKLVHYPDDNTAMLIKPQLTQIKKDGSPVHFRANKGWLSADGKTLKLQGNVVQRQGNIRASVGTMTIRLN
jgi:lipopolysaccharide export system protein LptC